MSVEAQLDVQPVIGRIRL